MNGIDLNSSLVRAVIVFILVGTMLWLAFYLFSYATGLDFFGETILILIGASWAAYWTWKKTSYGRY